MMVDNVSGTRRVHAAAVARALSPGRSEAGKYFKRGKWMRCSIHVAGV
jgi:hypothetical protein